MYKKIISWLEHKGVLLNLSSESSERKEAAVKSLHHSRGVAVTSANARYHHTAMKQSKCKDETVIAHGQRKYKQEKKSIK